MRMRMTLVLLSVAAVIPAVAVRALERTSVRSGNDEDGWVRSAPCAIQYYNNCTGWVYRYRMAPATNVGVLVDTCDGPSLLGQTSLFTASSGYTQASSTVSIHRVDASGLPIFPALALRSVPYLCSVGTGYPCEEWRTFTWNVEVPQTFMFLYSQAATLRFYIYFDHPAAGPTGLQACGYCYPSSRVGRTYYWPAGTIGGPGEVVNDGTCDSELMLRCTLTPLVTAVDPASDSMSWGGVKALYR